MNDDDDLDEFISVLQDVMLPSRVPVLPGLDVATHFSAPFGTAESTGAWFDIAAIGSGRVALVVGQVPGGGLAAALAAHGLNTLLRASLLRDGDPAGAVALAGLHAHDSADARGTSLTLAVVDPASGDLVYVTAGHDAPVVLAADGSTPVLPRTGARTLGYGGDIRAEHHRLAAGDLLLLGPGSLASYVDRDPATGAAGDAAATVASVARAMSANGVTETVTLVAVELRALDPDDLVIDLELDGTTGRRARLGLQEWLDTSGAPAMDALAIVHAAAELVANAVEHARVPEGGPAQVHVRAALTATGDVVVEVRDHGQWVPPIDDIARGRGLAMAAGLVDELEVTTSDDGTCARLRHRLSRPVRIDRETTGSGSAAPTVAAVMLATTAPGAVRLSGTFGPDDADRVGAELLLASRGGTRSLEVDLSEVTHLSADGLRMLGDLVGRTPGGLLQRSVVVLLAPDGSPAHTALERAGITSRAS